MLSSIDTVSSSPLDVRLEKYEGPLDLLLDLIRRQQIDIRDIPIAMITSQYLTYVNKARELDIDLGADFVFMASTLIHIKSKMLLPSDPALARPGAEEEDDPRTELVNKLLEHERFKNAAEMLQQKRMIEENVWSNPQIKQFISEDEDPGLAISLFDLVKAFNEVLERAKTRPTYEVASEEVSVEDMVRHLRALLQNRKDKPLFIMEVIEKQRTKRAMICLFLAVLEMVKLHAVELVQKDLFGEIALKRGEEFDSAFSGAQPTPDIEEEYK
jgi:segregation and condensation protein A